MDEGDDWECGVVEACYKNSYYCIFGCLSDNRAVGDVVTFLDF